jgi:hypothetical protein
MLKLTAHLLDKNIEADRVIQTKNWRRGEETYMLGINHRGSCILHRRRGLCAAGGVCVQRLTVVVRPANSPVRPLADSVTAVGAIVTGPKV